MNINKFLIIWVLVYGITALSGQNPIIRNQFSADPTARVFGDKVYLYPSHDIPSPPENPGKKDWFCMADYHVFSSSNLTEWTDHGVIVSQDKVDWVKPRSYSMWAPDCVFKNGKYYFYFPAPAKDTIYGKGFSIGVAIADKPEGPFVPEKKPIIGVHGIDPNVFIDKDGQAYLYWAAREIFVAKLKDNMVELATEPLVIANLPEKGLKEGPFTFERNGIYYLTIPHVENKTERLEYAIANSPLGPFKITGVIMDESPVGCWTNHQSIIQYNNQWYLFYHHNDLSPKFDKNRSVCIDSLFFNSDGTIQKVIPTLRGVGFTKATDQIEIDRYSSISNFGASIAFVDSLNTFLGWKVILDKPDAWIQYNAVDFGADKIKSLQLRVKAPNGGTLQIRSDKTDGPIVCKITVPLCSDWTNIVNNVPESISGKHNLFVRLSNGNPVEIDWLKFEK